MDDSSAALLKAASTALSGVCGGRVYGAPPPNPTFPYAMISLQSEPFNADDFSGFDHMLRVQIFSRQKKPAQALAERAKVYTALHRQGLAVDGLVFIEHDGVMDCFPEDDGKTWQGIVEFKVRVA